MKIKDRKTLTGAALLAVSAVSFVTSIIFLYFNLSGVEQKPLIALEGDNRIVLTDNSELVIDDIDKFITYNSPNTADGERKVYVNAQHQEVSKTDIKKILITKRVTAMYVPNFLSGSFYNATNLTLVNITGLEIKYTETEIPVTAANNFFRNAFYGCVNLERVDGLPSLPKTMTGLTSMNNYFTFTFGNCASLTYVSPLPALLDNLTALTEVNNYFAGTFFGALKLIDLPSVPPLPESSSGNITYLNYYLSGIYGSCKSAKILPALPKVPETAVNLKYVNGYLKQSYQNMKNRPEFAQNALPALPDGAAYLEEVDSYLSNLFYLTYPKNNIFPSLPALPASAVNIKKADDYLTAIFSMGLGNNLTYPELPALPKNAIGIVSLNNYLYNAFYQCYESQQFPVLPELPNTAELIYANGFLEQLFYGCRYAPNVNLPSLPVSAVKLQQINNYLAGTFKGSGISAVSVLPAIPTAIINLTQAKNFFMATFQNCEELVSAPDNIPALPTGSVNSMELENYCKQTYEGCKLLNAATISDVPAIPSSVNSLPADGTLNYAGGTNLVLPDTPMTAVNFHEDFNAWTMPVQHDLILNSGSMVFKTINMYETATELKSALLTPTKQYHTFVGWYTDELFTTAAESVIIMGTEDILLYAKWAEFEKYNLLLNSNGQVTSTISLHKTESISVADIPAPTNGDSYYSFGGWYVNSACTSPCETAITMGNTDINIYAKWNEFTRHNVVFDTNGGSDIDPISLHETETLNTEDITTEKAFHTFIGWFTDDSFETAASSPLQMGTADIVLYAQYNEFHKHNLILNSNGTVTATIALHETETKNKSSLPIPTNGIQFWTFGGWYIDMNLRNVAPITIIMGTEDINLYAEWINESARHNIVFNTNGGGKITSIVLHETESIGKDNLPNPNKENYKFIGWFADSEFINAVPEHIVMDTTDITLYAKWELTAVIFSFNTLGGSKIDDIKLNIGETLQLPMPMKDDFVFIKWYTDAELTIEFDGYRSITDNITLYAAYMEQSSPPLTILEINTESSIPTENPLMQDEVEWSGDMSATVTASIGAIGSVMFGVAGTMLTFNKKKRF